MSFSPLHAETVSSEAVETSEREQENFRDWVMKSKTLSEDEKAALKVDSVDAFHAFWERTRIAQDSFDHNHENGCGLWGRRYQRSAAFVLPFMDDFSPIIRIVKDLGAPYGGAAAGTLSLLFAVRASLLYLIVWTFKLTPWLGSMQQKRNGAKP